MNPKRIKFISQFLFPFDLRFIAKKSQVFKNSEKELEEEVQKKSSSISLRINTEEKFFIEY
jgi:hypothetical protein